MDNKAIEVEIKNLQNEVQSVKAINKDIKDLCLQMKELTVEMKYMRETQDEHSKRLQALEEKPIKRYDSAVTTIITGIVAAVIGFILAKIGLK